MYLDVPLIFKIIVNFDNRTRFGGCLDRCFQERLIINQTPVNLCVISGQLGADFLPGVTIKRVTFPARQVERLDFAQHFADFGRIEDQRITRWQ